MKSLSISGGGAKIAALAGASITLLRDFNYTPKYIVGTSAGGILSLPLALGLYDEVEELVKKIKLNDVFDISPVNNKGKIRLYPILRLLIGKESLGSQKNLMTTMKKLVSQELFTKYQSNPNYPTVYLCAAEYKTGSRKYFNLKEVDYGTFLLAVNATSAIPFFVESVKLAGKYYYDGSIRDHIGSHWLFENFDDIEENVSVYSRPEDYNMVDESWKPKHALEVLIRTTDIMLTEISKNDEQKEDILAKEKGIKNTKIFMPYLNSDGNYDFSNEKLELWYNTGKQQTTKLMSQ